MKTVIDKLKINIDTFINIDELENKVHFTFINNKKSGNFKKAFKLYFKGEYMGLFNVNQNLKKSINSLYLDKEFLHNNESNFGFIVNDFLDVYDLNNLTVREVEISVEVNYDIIKRLHSLYKRDMLNITKDYIGYEKTEYYQGQQTVKSYISPESKKTPKIKVEHTSDNNLNRLTVSLTIKTKHYKQVDVINNYHSDVFRWSVLDYYGNKVCDYKKILKVPKSAKISMLA